MESLELQVNVVDGVVVTVSLDEGLEELHSRGVVLGRAGLRDQGALFGLRIDRRVANVFDLSERQGASHEKNRKRGR